VNDLQYGGVQQQVADRAKIAANLRHIHEGNETIRRRDLKDFQNRRIGPFTDELGIEGEARVGGQRSAEAFREVGQPFTVSNIER
jgi:hypothetical protein